jgi:hypothetical protein
MPYGIALTATWRMYVVSLNGVRRELDLNVIGAEDMDITPLTALGNGLTKSVDL